MWLILWKFSILQTLWIFVFVIVFVANFLMVMYNARLDELQNAIIPTGAYTAVEFPAENLQSVDEKLEVLTERLAENEHALRTSQCDIKTAEKILTDLENKTSTCRDRYRSLMVNLKKDVRKTEEEVKMLRSQISNLSIRRELLRNEVQKQQEAYQNMLNNFMKELDIKNDTPSESSAEKSRYYLPKTSYPFRQRF